MRSKFKIFPKDSLKYQIEGQRKCSGSYHPYVFLWDYLLNKEWDSKEDLEEEIYYKLGATEKSLIIIKEVKK